MNVYICQRYENGADSWMGALIIAAHDEKEALVIYLREEMGCDPQKIVLMRDVSAAGEPRILYDDDTR